MKRDTVLLDDIEREVQAAFPRLYRHRCVEIAEAIYFMLERQDRIKDRADADPFGTKKKDLIT